MIKKNEYSYCHLLYLTIFFICTFFLRCTVYADTSTDNTLFLATNSDPKTFNLILANETSSTSVLGFLFEGLTEINGITTEPEPCLAESWTVSEDGRIWTINLRQDVKWFDGKPFTADDVVFTYNQLIYNENIPCSARSIFTINNQPFKIIKLAKYKVQIITPTPYAPLLRSLSQSILPKHVLEGHIKDNTFNLAWGINTKPQDIIGTGPYMLSEYIHGQRIVLIKNPNYWKKDPKGKKLPYIKTIIMFIVSNNDVQIMRFISGQIDVISVQGANYAFLKKYSNNQNFRLYDCGPSLGTQFIAFNLSNVFCDQVKYKWFKNKSFRKAIAYAIARNCIINNVYYGFAIPQYSPLNSSCGKFYTNNVKKYHYNPQKAKNILEKSGFIDRDNDGTVEDPYGNPVEFTILTNADNLIRSDIASIVQQDLQNIGINATSRPIDFNNLVERLTTTHNWDTVLLGLTGSIEPNSGKNVWSTDGFLHFWNPKPKKEKLDQYKKGVFKWEKQIDKIFNQAVTILNDNERYNLYKKWQQIVADNLPVIYTVSGKVTYAINKRIKNVHPTSHGGALHNIEELYIKENE